MTKPDKAETAAQNAAEYSHPADTSSHQAFSSHSATASHQTTPSDDQGQIRGDYALSKRRTIVIDHARQQVHIGGRPIRLSLVEYSILGLLAGRPYWPFSRTEIVQAVAGPGLPLTEDSLPDEIATLRDKLGPFSDYVQSVPGFGYRFKE